MNEILWHLLQSTLFAGAAWVVVLSMRRNSARTRYAIWMIASLKFLIPFALLVSAGAHLRWRVAPVMPDRARAFVHRGAESAASSAVGSVIIPYLRVEPTPPKNAAPILLALWFAGCAFILLRYFADWRRVAVLVRAAKPFPHVRTSAGVPILACGESLEPGVFGIFRPVLLLPVNIPETLTPAQLDAVIAHEMFHIRRRDNLTAALHMVIEAVFWFHPLVWWIGARLVEERERACDEAVVESGNEPHAYAEGILNICKSCIQSPSPCVSGVSGSNLQKRIEEIMSHRTSKNLRAGKRVTLALAGATVIGLPIFVGILNPSVHAQASAAAASQAARPEFEVISIKPNSPGGINTGTVRALPGGRLTAEQAVLRFFIQNAYGLKSFQISGGPAWMNSDGYDIEARAQGTPSAAQMRIMMQNLVADRFKLKAHFETKELPVYVLGLTKSGARSPSQNDAKCITPEQGFLGMPPRPPAPGEIYCGRPMISVSPSGASLQGDQVSIAELSRVLSNVLGRVVIDKTGFTGTLDFRLQFALDEALEGLPGRPPTTSAASADSSIFTVIQEQLGLKLESTKGPVEVLMIDYVERPTEN